MGDLNLVVRICVLLAFLALYPLMRGTWGLEEIKVASLFPGLFIALLAFLVAWRRGTYFRTRDPIGDRIALVLGGVLVAASLALLFVYKGAGPAICGLLLSTLALATCFWMIRRKKRKR